MPYKNSELQSLLLEKLETRHDMSLAVAHEGVILLLSIGQKVRIQVTTHEQIMGHYRHRWTLVKG